jgi:hypothetical protein
MDKITTRTDEYGNKYWFLNGKFHRVDGPAIEYANGSKFWYLNGKRHRIDGPAIEYADGSKFWFLNGVEILEKDFIVKTSNNENEIENAIQVLKKFDFKIFKTTKKGKLKEV